MYRIMYSSVMASAYQQLVYALADLRGKVDQGELLRGWQSAVNKDSGVHRATLAGIVESESYDPGPAVLKRLREAEQRVRLSIVGYQRPDPARMRERLAAKLNSLSDKAIDSVYDKMMRELVMLSREDEAREFGLDGFDQQGEGPASPEVVVDDTATFAGSGQRNQGSAG